MSADLVWGGILGAGFAYEAYTLFNKRHGDTLSERTRTWFRTRTKPGKIVFMFAWSAFAAWFLIHIVRG